MGLFSWWTSPPPPPPLRPEPPPPPPPRPLRVRLETAPPFHPLPVNSADPLDAEVSRQWLAFTRSSSSPAAAAWSSFIADLKRRIADAETATAKTAHELSDFKDDP